MTLASTVTASSPRALRTPSGRTARPAQGATATTGPARRWPGAARTCGGQVRRAQPRDRQGGEGGSRSQAGGLTRSCLQARGWRWKLASSTASPKAAGLGSPCHSAGERPSWPNSPGARAWDVPLPGATRRSSAQRSLRLSRGLSDGRGGGAALPCPALRDPQPERAALVGGRAPGAEVWMPVAAWGLGAPGALSLEQAAPQSSPVLVPLSPGSTSVALSSVRGGRRPRNVDTARSPSPQTFAGLSSRTAARSMSRCPRAPSAGSSRWAGHASRSGCWAQGELAGPTAGPWRLWEKPPVSERV